MSPFFGKGVLISVEVTMTGEPLRLTWEGDCHQIDAISDKWRVDQGWWEKHHIRDYFKLTTTSGFLLVVYHDLIRDQWYLQRLYD